MEIFGVPDCNLSKIDYRIGIEFFSALEECFQRYPLLKNVINCIGDYQYVLEKRNIMAMQAFNQKKVHYDLKALYKTSSFCASYLTTEGTKYYEKLNNLMYYNRLLFSGICINEKDSYDDLRYMLRQYKNKNMTYCINVKSCVYHEVGHILSRMLGIEKSVVTLAKINELMEIDEDYPKYTMTSVSEFVADCFAKYMVDQNYNEAVNTIGTTIDLFYRYFEKVCKDFYSQDLYKEKVLKIER